MSNNVVPSSLVLKRCDDLIEWYERNKTRQRYSDYILQIAVVVASGITVLAATMNNWPKWTVVLPAVITTISTGLNITFRFRSKYVSFAIAAEKLKWAKLRYQIRSADSTNSIEVLEEFVHIMESIVTSEMAEWRDGLLSANNKDNGKIQTEEKKYSES